MTRSSQIGVGIDSDVNAVCNGTVDKGKNLIHLPPILAAYCLQMRQLNRNSSPSSQVESFFYRLQYLKLIVPQMARVEAIVFSDNPAELQ